MDFCEIQLMMVMGFISLAGMSSQCLRNLVVCISKVLERTMWHSWKKLLGIVIHGSEKPWVDILFQKYLDDQTCLITHYARVLVNYGKKYAKLSNFWGMVFSGGLVMVRKFLCS